VNLATPSKSVPAASSDCAASQISTSVDVHTFPSTDLFGYSSIYKVVSSFFIDLYKSVNIDENKRTYKKLKSETSERSNFPSRCIVDRHVMQISLSHRRAWQCLK
jgi:hypothetical protein